MTFWERTSNPDRVRLVILFVVCPLAYVYTTYRIHEESQIGIKMTQNLIDGHNMCVPYDPADVGIKHRNAFGQLDLYE